VKRGALVLQDCEGSRDCEGAREALVTPYQVQQVQLAPRDRQGLAGCQDYQDQEVKQEDRGTLDQLEQAVSQVQQVQLGPRDLLVHKVHQAWWRKRMGLRWYQDPQDPQDHKGLRVLQEQMEFRGRLEYLV